MLLLVLVEPVEYPLLLVLMVARAGHHLTAQYQHLVGVEAPEAWRLINSLRAETLRLVHMVLLVQLLLVHQVRADHMAFFIQIRMLQAAVEQTVFMAQAELP